MKHRHRLAKYLPSVLLALLSAWGTAAPAEESEDTRKRLITGDARNREIMQEPPIREAAATAGADCYLRMYQIPESIHRDFTFVLDLSFTNERIGSPAKGAVTLKVRISDGKLLQRTRDLTSEDIDRIRKVLHDEEFLSLPSEQDPKWNSLGNSHILYFQYFEREGAYLKEVLRARKGSEPANRIATALAGLMTKEIEMIEKETGPNPYGR